MIRYDIDDDELERRIEAESASWLDRARSRTDACGRLHAFDGGSGIWSEIKAVYMRLQHNKCAYCERKLAGEPFGLIEHDVEHYRPKNAVRVWPDEAIRQQRKIRYRFPTGGAHPEGYYLLAFHPRNYITACKTCNSPLKSNFFPIAGPRALASDGPDALASERPYLVHPLGLGDADRPEDILTFEGITPRPARSSGHRHRRARVMIDFFELDTREELIRGRAVVISSLQSALLVLHSPSQDDANKDYVSGLIRILTSPDSEHCNCARAFLKLHGEAPARARELANSALAYLETLDHPAHP